MADVILTIGGRPHMVACREGDEPNLHRLAAVIDERWAAAQRAAGGNADRAMLFVALMLADALQEAEERPPEGAGAAMLERLADRLESLASALEESPASA